VATRLTLSAPLSQYIIRKAFDVGPDGERPYLPDEILWRQKEQFSDGVGYSWIDGLKNYAEEAVSDEKLAGAAQRYTIDTPETKEAYLIREIFESHFPTDSAASTAVRWIPKKEWGCASDPSGRAVAIHDSAYKAQ
jgi:asparagine synthase (glutamine-hydrolysing)